MIKINGYTKVVFLSLLINGLFWLISYLLPAENIISSLIFIVVFFYFYFDFIYKILYKIAGVKKGAKANHQQQLIIRKYWMIWIAITVLSFIVPGLIDGWLSTFISIMVSALFLLVMALSYGLNRKKLAGYKKEELFK